MHNANTIEDVKNFILCDDMTSSGNSLSSLVEFTKTLDANTTIEYLDYGQATILHHVGEEGRFLYYMPMQVGDENIFVAGSIKSSNGEKSIRMMGPKCVALDYVDVVRSENGAGQGLLAEIMDPYDITGGKIFGTIIYFPKNHKRADDLYLFLSPIVHKTMYARFQLKTRYISMARDLAFHQTLCQMRIQAVQESSKPDANTILVGCYTVMRGKGKYRKPIATFTRKDCRIAFSKAINAIITNKSIGVINWKFSQADGLVANFRYNWINDVINNIGIKYRPAIGARICDSGKSSNCLFIGWYDPVNPEKSLCWVHQYNLQSINSSENGDVIEAIKDDSKRSRVVWNENTWRSDILDDIDTFIAWKDYTEHGNPEVLVEKFLKLMTFKDVGAKVRSAIVEHMTRQAPIEEYTVTWYTLFQRFVEAMCECVEIDSINDYAKSLLHYNNINALFTDKDHWSIRKLNGINNLYAQMATEMLSITPD